MGEIPKRTILNQVAQEENDIETKVTNFESTPSVNPKNGNSLFKLQIFDIFEDKFNTS
jgi:hypothetical protein